MDDEETLQLLMVGCLSKADDLGLATNNHADREEFAKFLITLGWTYDLNTLEKP